MIPGDNSKDGSRLPPALLQGLLPFDKARLGPDLSLLQHLHQSYRPHTAVIVLDAADHWRMEQAIPGRMTKPGLVMFWFGADLFYANAEFFSQQVRSLVEKSPSPVRWLVVDATAITDIDFSAARTLVELQQDLEKGGVTLVVVLVPMTHHLTLEQAGLIDLIGADRIFESRRACLEAYETAVLSESVPPL